MCFPFMAPETCCLWKGRIIHLQSVANCNTMLYFHIEKSYYFKIDSLKGRDTAMVLIKTLLATHCNNLLIILTDRYLDSIVSLVFCTRMKGSCVGSLAIIFLPLPFAWCHSGALL